jgi:hypothetical protein
MNRRPAAFGPSSFGGPLSGGNAGSGEEFLANANAVSARDYKAELAEITDAELDTRVAAGLHAMHEPYNHWHKLVTLMTWAWEYSLARRHGANR